MSREKELQEGQIPTLTFDEVFRQLQEINGLVLPVEAVALLGFDQLAWRGMAVPDTRTYKDTFFAGSKDGSFKTLDGSICIPGYSTDNLILAGITPQKPDVAIEAMYCARWFGGNIDPLREIFSLENVFLGLLSQLEYRENEMSKFYSHFAQGKSTHDGLSATPWDLARSIFAAITASSTRNVVKIVNNSQTNLPQMIRDIWLTVRGDGPKVTVKQRTQSWEVGIDDLRLQVPERIPITSRELLFYG